jgi:exosortase
MIGAIAWAAAIAWVYGPTLVGLVRQWDTDPTYSHGWIVAPIAFALAWSRRSRLRALPLEPSGAGLWVIAASLAMYTMGRLGAELFLTRVSLIGVIAGTILFTFGRAHLRVVAFPLGFLLFMIPLPAIVLDRATVQLQLVASALGERLLQSVDTAVLRDGNVLRLSTVTLEVNEACAGVRSLIALFSVTSLLAWTCDSRWPGRLIVAASAVPIAVVLNGVRIAVTGLAALEFGPAAAAGLAHDMVGLATFAAGVACAFALHMTMGGRPATREMAAL